MDMIDGAVVVDADQFVAWAQGILIWRDGEHQIFVNETACSDAEEAARNGRRVLFARGGKLTGTELVMDAVRHNFVEIR